MSRPKAKQPAAEPGNLGAWLGAAVERYRRAGAALGQISPEARDEALYLMLSALGLPLESGPEVLERVPTPAERRRLESVLRRRLEDKVPAAYLTGEAWLAGHRFRVDHRALIPRSYFLEIIPKIRMQRRTLRLADVGTGSGCLAILLAHRFPRARVDAIDVSPGALELAALNVSDHGLAGRVRLWRSDVFDAVPPARYDVILSNPPYEPTARVERLPAEFRREPRLALDGGRDGLDVIRKLLRQAPARLNPGGRVLIEVGGLRRAMEREFGGLGLRWLRTQDGSDCVCSISAAAL